MRSFIYAALVSGILVPVAALGQGTPSRVSHDEGSGQTTQSGASSASTSPATGSGAGAASTPSDRSAPSASPTSSGGGSAPLPWRGSVFIFDQSVSAETIVPNATLTYRPSYQWWISIRPRWALTPTITLTARQDITLEWFNTADTTTFREPQLGDLWTDVIYRGLPPVWGVRTVVGARVQWPLSLASRARGTYFTLGAVVSMNRAFDKFAGGSLSLGLAFVGSHPFTRYTSGGNIVVDRGPDGSLDPARYGCMIARPRGDVGESTNIATCDYMDAAMNPAFSLATMFTAGYQTPLPQLSLTAMLLLFNAWLYQTPDAVLCDRMAGCHEVPRASDDNRLRQSTWVLLSADYEVVNWLSLSLGYYSFRSVLDPNGRYGNPFYSPNGSSRLFLTATVALDALYTTLFGAAERGAGGGGGAARGVTMNEVRPRRRWSPNDAARELREQQAVSGFFL